jgi:BlaI family penicillinase repressor
MKELTKAEDQVMQILWKLKKAFVNDIIDKIPEPKPAYNTVSTIVRILEKKGFVSYNAYGKSHQYYPLVEKTAYSDFYLKSMITSYFGGSFDNLVSFFAKENKLDIKDIDALMKHVKGEIKTEDQ